jgi:hypothetical protein
MSNSVIPPELLESVENNEEILFKSPEILVKKKGRIHHAIAFFGFLWFTWVFIPLVRYMADVIWLYFIFAILIPTICFFITRSFGREEKYDTYFLLTDKALYLYHYQHQSKLKTIDKYTYSSLSGVSFRRRFYDKKGDFGTARLISNELIPVFIDIQNIPHFSKFQIIFESILYEYGTIRDNWVQLRDNIEFQFPLEYQISREKVGANFRSQKKHLIVFILILVISITLYVVAELLVIELWFISWIVFGGLIFLNLVMVRLLLLEWVMMKRRVNPSDALLTIEEDSINISSGPNFNTFLFSKMISLDILKSIDPYTSPRNPEENYDFIRIFNGENPLEEIAFGPFEGLPHLISFLFSYLIIWKEKKGFLLSEEELSELNGMM